MTLLLRCVSAWIELRCHLGHAYIISNTLYTGSGCWFHLGSAYLHICFFMNNTLVLMAKCFDDWWKKNTFLTELVEWPLVPTDKCIQFEISKPAILAPKLTSRACALRVCSPPAAIAVTQAISQTLICKALHAQVNKQRHKTWSFCLKYYILS